MRKEIELKFEVTPRDLRKLRAARGLRRKPLKEENLVSVYFDTTKHALARNDVTVIGSKAMVGFEKFDEATDRPAKA
jgi:triphosphatase